MSPTWLTSVAPDRAFPATVAIGASHYGGGCTFGDILGGWMVFLLAVEIAGVTLLADYAVDLAIGFVLGMFGWMALVQLCWPIRRGIEEAM